MFSTWARMVRRVLYWNSELSMGKVVRRTALFIQLLNSQRHMGNARDLCKERIGRLTQAAKLWQLGEPQASLDHFFIYSSTKGFLFFSFKVTDTFATRVGSQYSQKSRNDDRKYGLTPCLSFREDSECNKHPQPYT